MKKIDDLLKDKQIKGFTIAFIIASLLLCISLSAMCFVLVYKMLSIL